MLQQASADPHIDETAPSIGYIKEAEAKWRGGKAAGICHISAELLKAGGEAMIHGMCSAYQAMCLPICC